MPIGPNDLIEESKKKHDQEVAYKIMGAIDTELLKHMRTDSIDIDLRNQGYCFDKIYELWRVLAIIEEAYLNAGWNEVYNTERENHFTWSFRTY